MSVLTSVDSYSAFQWTFCAVPIITTAGRLYIRYHSFRAFQADDVFNVLALLALIAGTAVTEVDNRADPYDSTLELQLQLAGDMLLWATLYLVKASFLALIWSIFNVSSRFRKAWWVVTIYTFLTFWPVFISELWQCGTPATYDDASACDTYLLIQNLQQVIYIRFALHISSDLFILILPLVQLRKLHMPLGKKLSAAAVFALIIIDIAVGIARNVSIVLAALGVPTDTSGAVDIICAVVEPSVAVIVCSLPAYRALVFRIRSRQSYDEIQPNAANAAGKQKWSRKFSLLTAGLTSPLLEISILQERRPELTERGSDETSVEAPSTGRSVEVTAEKQP